LEARNPAKVVAVALAKKTARIVWAPMKYGFPLFTKEPTRCLLPTAVVKASAEGTEMELLLILLYTSICIAIFTRTCPSLARTRLAGAMQY
jgi:hypothetical protein